VIFVEVVRVDETGRHGASSLLQHYRNACVERAVTPRQLVQCPQRRAHDRAREHRVDGGQ